MTMFAFNAHQFNI